METLSQNYRVSLAIWDHTMLLATQSDMITAFHDSRFLLFWCGRSGGYLTPFRRSTWYGWIRCTYTVGRRITPTIDSVLFRMLPFIPLSRTNSQFRLVSDSQWR